jgi:hypothetical protein
MIKLSFLSSSDGIRLTKTVQMVNGELKINPYPNVYGVTSHTVEVADIDQFHQAVLEHAAKGHCLLKGTLNRELVNESRGGTTNTMQETQWICLDIDGLPGINSAEKFIALLPEYFHDVNYVSQASCSMGINPEKGYSAHIFMLLNKPVSAPLLKEWLIHLNLTIPTLRQNIRANKNYTAPRWPLDASTCQNDKLIFITPPVLKDGVVDQFQGDRIQLVEKERGALPLNLDPIDADYNDREGRQVLNKKRKAAGKPEHKFKTKTVDDVQVLIDAGKITISEIKEERDFVYMNLNGGDSWGYWHSVTNPKILYNFKGEPNLLLEDVAPGYYYSALKKLYFPVFEA